MRHVVRRETANAWKILLIGKLQLNRRHGMPNIKSECEVDSSGSGYGPLARMNTVRKYVSSKGGESDRVSDYRRFKDSKRKNRNW